MRVGAMVGPERGDAARKVTRMIDEIRRAEGAGLPTAWIPQIPGDFDAPQALTLRRRTMDVLAGIAADAK